jgi:hypothetical protein
VEPCATEVPTWLGTGLSCAETSRGKPIPSENSKIATAETQAEIERISGVRIQRMKDVPEMITGTIPESTRGQQFDLLIYSSID